MVSDHYAGLAVQEDSISGLQKTFELVAVPIGP